MFALPYLSGTDCIELLKRFGYRVRSRSGGFASLVLDANVVVVPEASTLSPTLVGAILRTANVDPYTLIHELGPPSSQQVA